MKFRSDLFVVAITAPVLAISLWLGGSHIAEAQKMAPSVKAGEPLSANAFVELAKICNPAVVNISTTTLAKGRVARDPFFDVLEQMYGMQMQPPQQRAMQALGTGFMIREDGLLITNNHVIAGADQIRVQFDEKSDKLLDAKLVGSDERTDIALLKIEGSNFPVLRLGSSAGTEVGEWVAAFGNPFGNGHTMTKGIISAKNRDISEINRFPLLQTDAPINPGNSGGPLVNLRGEVIGVNSAIVDRAQGISFAIPIDEVKTIIPQLEKSGKIRKGYLGVGLSDIDPRAAMELGLKDPEGTVILSVDPAGSGYKGGLRPYDVIVEFNGKKIKFSRDLMDAVAGATIGSSVSVKIVRDGKSKTLTVSVMERPDTKLPTQRNLARKDSKGSKVGKGLGFQVADANHAIRQEFNLEDDVKKPIVVDVDPKSPAAAAGLMPGDVVLDVNRKEVSASTEVNRLIKKGTNTFRVFRQGATLLILLKDE